jgi:diguanylate cyclase (GGDEF)-like protein
VPGPANRERRRKTNAWLAAGLGVVVVLDLALFWIVVGPALVRRLDERSTALHGGGPGVAALDGRAFAPVDLAPLLADGVPAAAYDRVVRVASWAYLLSTAAVAYATGLWPGAEEPLLLVLAIGGVFILVAHDLLPATMLGTARFLIEGAVAITIVSVVVVLTGGAESPFFYAYPLVVAGVALVVRPRVTIALATVAISGYLLAAVAAVGWQPLGEGHVAVLAVNLTALFLLTYVAMVVAREQRRTRDAAVRLSATDALTGLANRAYVLAAVEREIDRATRYGHGFCVLMADLDGLKELNDTYGHRVGDRALAGVAGVIRENVRRIDTPARLGGDEFVVLLPETDRAGARVVADKVRQGVAALELVEGSERIPLGVSIGLGEWSRGRSLDDIMVAADDAMYDVKRLGRRRPNGRTMLAAVGPGRGADDDQEEIASIGTRRGAWPG